MRANLKKILAICVLLLIPVGLAVIHRMSPERTVSWSIETPRQRLRSNSLPGPPPDIGLAEWQRGEENNGRRMARKLNLGRDFTAFSINVRPLNFAPEERLTVGSQAPQLSQLKHAGGQPLPKQAAPGIRIVHFWAPWHPLSLQSLRRLSELQRQNGDKVFVVHVTEESPEAIRDFLNSKDASTGRLWSEQTAGAFVDDRDGQAHTTWMKASKLTELPAVFLVGADGVLQWFGVAGSVENPLRRLMAGTWTIEEAAVHVESGRRVYEAISSAARQDECLEAVREASEAAPEDLDAALMLLDIALEAEDYRMAADAAETAYGLCGQSAESLSSLAWVLISGSNSRRAPLATALKAAQRAVDLTNRSSESLETLARVQISLGDTAPAVESQREAVAGAGGDRRELQEAILRNYERLLKAGKSRR
ncbi:MAG: Sporulation thiol-disulfide oxidoreductase precursor [Planctomycetota bacterium]